MAVVFFKIKVLDFILKPFSMISGVISPMAQMRTMAREYDSDYEFACAVITGDDSDQHGNDYSVYVFNADVPNFLVES